MVVADIGATWTRIGSAAGEPPVILSRTPPDAESILALVVEGVEAVSDDPIGLAVACPGEVSGGVVGRSFYTALSGIDVGATLSKRLSRPVVVVNDVDAQAVGCREVGPEYFTISVGSAVGGAHVREGVVVAGRTRSISEIGHVPVGSAYRRCACGQFGCLDTVLSGIAVTDRLGPDWWHRDDVETRETLREGACGLVQALRTVSSLFELDAICLVGRIFESNLFLDLFRRESFDSAHAPLHLFADSWQLVQRGLATLLEGPAGSVS